MRYFAQAMEMADELSDPIHWVQTAYRKWELGLGAKIDGAELPDLRISSRLHKRGARDLHEYGLMLLSTSQFIMGHHDESVSWVKS